MRIFRNDYDIIQGKESILIAFTLVTFFSFWVICMPDSTLYSGNASSVRKMLTYMILFIFPVVAIRTKGLIEKKHIPICFIPFIYWSITNFHVYQDAYPLNITGVIICSFFLLLNGNYKASLYVLMKRLLLLLSIFGILSYILYLGGMSPIQRVDYYGEKLGGYYYNYLLSVLYVKDGTARLCSLFNEPGYFGTITAILLCVEKIRLRKKENIIFLISGMLTFSLGFYFTLILYYIFENLRSPSKIILFLFLAILYLYVLPSFHTGIDGIDTILERIQISDGKINGDNRSNEYLDYILATTFIGDSYLWGMGRGYCEAMGVLSVSSYKTYLVEYGILGFCLLYIYYIIVACRCAKGNRDALLLVLIFFINIYQRPNVFNMIYYMMLFGGISYLKRQAQIKRKNLM